MRRQGLAGNALVSPTRPPVPRKLHLNLLPAFPLQQWLCQSLASVAFVPHVGLSSECPKGRDCTAALSFHLGASNAPTRLLLLFAHVEVVTMPSALEIRPRPIIRLASKGLLPDYFWGVSSSSVWFRRKVASVL